LEVWKSSFEGKQIILLKMEFVMSRAPNIWHGITLIIIAMHIRTQTYAIAMNTCLLHHLSVHLQYKINHKHIFTNNLSSQGPLQLALGAQP
jgi:hypothetical protein